VVDKPVGMPVQETRESGRGTLLEALRDVLATRRTSLRVVHRLDTVASGAVVVALSQEAAAGLSASLASHQVHRNYLALVHGEAPLEAQLRHYVTPLQKDAKGNARVHARPAKGTPRGGEREAVCQVQRWAFLRDSQQGSPMSLVKVSLETGRTHQIRVQLASLGLPIVGDVRYGAPGTDGSLEIGIALHAATLEFDHPVSLERIRCLAPLPPRFSRWCEAAELSAGELEAKAVALLSEGAVHTATVAPEQDTHEQGT
jgi:RluA family pseudouridine synthase